jgi:hypothetical protein
MDRLKVQAMLDWPVPRPARAVRGFLGLAGYYCQFIRDFGAIAALLTALLKKEGFRWNEDATRVFKELQRALTTAPVLQLPDFDRDFIVECDASGSGFGAVLHQGAGLVAFYSKLIAPRHAKLSAYERELIGLVQAVRHWRSYLWGVPFSGSHRPSEPVVHPRPTLDDDPAAPLGQQAPRFQFCGGVQAGGPRHRRKCSISPRRTAW